MRVTTRNVSRNGSSPVLNSRSLQRLGGSPNRMIRNDEALFQSLLLSRSALLDRLIDVKHDIDRECGYPVEFTPYQYRRLYDREGIPQRVVNLFPNECWSQDPELYETEDDKKTEWEKRVYDLIDEHNLWSICQRADEMSGIGFYGIILLGFNDGLDLAEPLIDDDTGQVIEGNIPRGGLKLKYLKVFDETLVRVQAFEQDSDNPRYTHPTFYSVRLVDLTVGIPEAVLIAGNYFRRIHWSRVIHLADHRKSSDVYGVPRQRPHLNRLLDLRKIYGGSAEMFWKGGFPGIVFEVMPEIAGEVEFGDKQRAELRTEFASYQAGLSRYLALLGVTAKPLSVEVAQPQRHIMEQLRAIAAGMECPLRVLLGSEEAKLASATDKRTWNERLGRRNVKYTTPYVIRPLIDRFNLLGVLPRPKKRFKTAWPDLNRPTDQDKANLAITRTQAIVQYVAAGADVLIPPLQFLTIILGMTTEEATAILESAGGVKNYAARARKQLQQQQKAQQAVDQSRNVARGIKEAQGGNII